MDNEETSLECTLGGQLFFEMRYQLLSVSICRDDFCPIGNYRQSLKKCHNQWVTGLTAGVLHARGPIDGVFAIERICSYISIDQCIDQCSRLSSTFGLNCNHDSCMFIRQVDRCNTPSATDAYLVWGLNCKEQRGCGY